MKKVFQYIVLLTSVVFLASCVVSKGDNSSTSKSEKTTAKEVKNKDMSLAIKSGEFVYPQNAKASDETYLMLQIQIKNNRKEKLTLSSSDFALYNEEGEKITAGNIYAYDIDFSTLGLEDVSAGKSLTTHVVFEVEEDTKYDLELQPKLNLEEVKPLEISINTKDYQDNSEEALVVAKTFVEGVFLNKTETETDTKKDGKEEDSESVADQFESERSAFKSEFITNLKNDFYNYTPTDEELNKVFDAYVAANAKRSKVTYTISEYLGNYAVVLVYPETVSFEDIDVFELSNEYRELESGDYTTAREKADKRVLAELPGMFDTATVKAHRYMDREGVRLVMVKNKSGEWEIDTSDYNFDTLIDAFTGGV